mgnify:CR=1 FL=1
MSCRGGRSGFGTGTSSQRNQFSASTSGYGGQSTVTQSAAAAVTEGVSIKAFLLYQCVIT